MTYHFVLIEELDDDRRWILLNFFVGSVNQYVVEKKEFVPRRTQSFVDHLSRVGKFAANYSGEGIGKT